MEFLGVLFDAGKLRENKNWGPEIEKLLMGLYRYGIRVCDIGGGGLNNAKAQGLLPENCILIADCMETVRQAEGELLAVLGYENDDTPSQSNGADSEDESEPKDTSEASISEHLTGVPIIVEGFGEVDFYFLERIYQRFHGLPWTVLETERCRLREITIEDLGRLYEIYAEPEITKYMEGLYEDPLEEEEYTKAYIKNMYGFFGYGVWIVVEKEHGEIIGRAGLNHLELDGECHLELGYMIAMEWQNKGYAEEVCRSVLNFAREALYAGEVTCLIEEGNDVSVRLAEKLGFFRKEDRIVDSRLMQRYVRIFTG